MIEADAESGMKTGAEMTGTDASGIEGGAEPPGRCGLMWGAAALVGGGDD